MKCTNGHMESYLIMNMHSSSLFSPNGDETLRFNGHHKILSPLLFTFRNSSVILINVICQLISNSVDVDKWFVGSFGHFENQIPVHESGRVSCHQQQNMVCWSGQVNQVNIWLHSGDFLNKKIVCDLFIKCCDFTHSQPGKLLCPNVMAKRFVIIVFGVCCHEIHFRD